MDATALKNQVRVLIGETTADFWTDLEVENQINRGISEMAMEFEEHLLPEAAHHYIPVLTATCHHMTEIYLAVIYHYMPGFYLV